MPEHQRFTNAARLEEKLQLRERWKLDPGIWDLLPWPACTVRILMVADGFLYFSDEDFGLSDLVGVLKNEPFPFARFEITAAHRQAVTDAEAGIGNPNITRSIKNFRFDDADDFPAGAFDQVWLFGSRRSRQAHVGAAEWEPRLSDAEIRKVHEFMEQDGGVFATGDHEDLGAALSGFLPRIRVMRHWFFPEVGPWGDPVAPPFEGPGRVDTNRVGHDPDVQFEDQSDDVPQEIEPTWYKRRVGVFLEEAWPHPLLCGPRGTIRVLPDHPHESVCVVPLNLNATFTLADGFAVTEFPAAVGGGVKPIPEIVATARVIGGHMTSGKSGVTVSRSFGAIGAYDGHRAGVGRIVVDSTWHHFINVNLTGDSTQPAPKSVGFLATAAGQAVYEEVKAYFRNIALWMSPPRKLRCMRSWALLTAINSHRLHEVYDPWVTLDNAKLFDYIVLGRHARDVLGKYASRCQSRRWVSDLMAEFIEQAPLWVDPSDPWAPRADLETWADEDSPAWLELDWMGDASVGGAVLAIRESMFPLRENLDDDADERIDGLVRAGAAAGLDAAASHLQEGIRQLKKFGLRTDGGNKQR